MNIAPLFAAVIVAAAASTTAVHGFAMAEPAESQTIMLTLTGATQGPGRGDSDGRGTAELRINPETGQFCYKVTVSDIAPAVYTHIHKAPAGSGGGPIMVELEPPADGSSEGCVTIAPEVARTLLSSPADYYLNVHNADHPAGAIRAQLG